MKTLIVSILLFISVSAVRAQGGYTIHAYQSTTVKDGEKITKAVNNIYTVSITDKYMVCNVLVDNVVKKSQFFGASDFDQVTVDGVTKQLFKATSGITREIVSYEVEFMKDRMILTERHADGIVFIYEGTFAICFTFAD